MSVWIYFSFLQSLNFSLQMCLVRFWFPVQKTPPLSDTDLFFYKRGERNSTQTQNNHCLHFRLICFSPNFSIFFKSNHLYIFMEQKFLLHMHTLHKLTFYTTPINCKLDGPDRQMCVIFISSFVRAKFLNTSKSISENVCLGITAIFMVI